jgi:hypothetical protein
MGVKVLLTLGVAGKAISMRKAKKAIGIIKASRIRIGRHLVQVGAAATPPSLVLGSVCVMNECSVLNQDLNNYPIVQFTHHSSLLCTSPELMTPLHNLPLLNCLLVCLWECIAKGRRQTGALVRTEGSYVYVYYWYVVVSGVRAVLTFRATALTKGAIA